MQLKKLTLALAVGAVSLSAQADLVQIWSFQDDSIDFILRETPTGLSLVTGGSVQPGDIFVSVFEMPTASALPYPLGSGPGSSLIPPGQELTGVSVVQLVTSNPASTSPWIFQPYTGGMNAVLALMGTGAPTVVGGNAGGGAVAAMWLNGTTNGDTPGTADRNLILDASHPTYGPTTNCTNLTDCLREASWGQLFQVDGFWGDNPSDRYDPDNFWVASPFPFGGTNPDYDTVKSGASSTNFASFQAGLSNLYNIVEPVFWQNIITGTLCAGGYTGGDGCVQMRVSGTILGGAGLNNGAVARDDIDASKLVPEPATLGLLGLGLLGLGLLRRRQA